MINFKYPVSVGTHPETGAPVIGFEHESMFIFDPFSSSCGRFAVDPWETYGLTLGQAISLVKTNSLLYSATEDAINAGCSTLQDFFITTGDVAGLHFAGAEQWAPIALALAHYAVSEINMARENEA